MKQQWPELQCTKGFSHGELFSIAAKSQTTMTNTAIEDLKRDFGYRVSRCMKGRGENVNVEPEISAIIVGGKVKITVGIMYLHVPADVRCATKLNFQEAKELLLKLTERRLDGEVLLYLVSVLQNDHGVTDIKYFSYEDNFLIIGKNIAVTIKNYPDEESLEVPEDIPNFPKVTTE